MFSTVQLPHKLHVHTHTRLAILKCRRRKSRKTPEEDTHDQEFRMTSISHPVTRSDVTVTSSPPTSASTSAILHSLPARRQAQIRTESQGNRSNHSITPQGPRDRRRHTDGIQNRLQTDIRLNVPSSGSGRRTSNQTNTYYNSEEDNDSQRYDDYVQNNTRSQNNTSSRTTSVHCIPNPAYYANNVTEEHVTPTSHLNITNTSNRDNTTSPVSADTTGDTTGDHMYDYPRFETQEDDVMEHDNQWSLASDAYAN